MTKILMNKQQSRRLAALAKMSDNILLILSKTSTIFLVDNIEYFKAVKFNGESANELQVYSIDSNLVIATCLDEGSLNIDLDTENSLVSISYVNKNNESVIAASGVASRIPESRIADVYNFMNLTGCAPLKIHALEFAKVLIDMCMSTNHSLIITPNIITTTSTSLKVFIHLNENMGVKNPIGLTIDALKEIDRFKVDCSVYDMANYLILNRPGFILGVRKANIKSVDMIPPQYFSNEGALYSAELDLGSFGHFLGNISSKILKADSSCVCAINFDQKLITVKQDSEVYGINIGAVSTSNTDIKNKMITVQLRDLLNIKNILTSGPIAKIAVYKNIVKFDVGGICVLMRWNESVRYIRKERDMTYEFGR